MPKISVIVPVYKVEPFLSECVNSVLEQSFRDFDLILSGHAHGGQWRIGRQGIFAPSQGLFPRLTEGVHDGRLLISRGLANRTPVPRLNNPPETVYIQPPVPGFEFDN